MGTQGASVASTAIGGRLQAIDPIAGVRALSVGGTTNLGARSSGRDVDQMLYLRSRTEQVAWSVDTYLIPVPKGRFALQHLMSFDGQCGVGGKRSCYGEALVDIAAIDALERPSYVNGGIPWFPILNCQADGGGRDAALLE